MSQRQELRLAPQQRLELRLSPQIIQRIEILQLPTIELEQRIQEELVKNPMLELVEASQPDEPVEAPENRVDSEYAKLSDIEPIIADHGSLSSNIPTETEEDSKVEALQNVPARSISLQDYLYQQFLLLSEDPREREIAYSIIYNIDNNGYLMLTKKEGEEKELVPGIGVLMDASEERARQILSEALPELDPPPRIQEGERVLRKIQSLDPPGVGARSLKEALLLQLHNNATEHPLAGEVIQNHLRDLLHNRLPKISEATGHSIDEIKKVAEFIGSLNPRPGSVISAEVPPVVSPDVVVEYRDGRYEVELARDYSSQLRINPDYLEMIDKLSRSSDKKEKRTAEYLKEKLRDARSLMDGIEQRRDTLLKVAREVIEAQKEFLEKGLGAIKPLKMHTIAEQAGVHVSTVSRAVHGKYIQTPRGLFELRFFFTGGVSTENGEIASQRAVKQAIKEIIEKENKKEPLTDDRIAEVLRSKGINIARRTVTKYRKALGIPSARQRKEY